MSTGKEGDLDRAEEKDEAKLDAVRAAVRAGEESGVAEGNVFPELRYRVRQRALKAKRRR
jgi:hypothetical protein